MSGPGKTARGKTAQGETAQTVRASFDTSERMQDAVGRLAVSGFDRAEMTLPGHDGPTGRPADTKEDARQMRTLGASTAGAAAALAAAGISIASGGAAAPAAAAAAIAGGAVGGAAYAAQEASNESEQRQRNLEASSGDLVLSVRTASAAKQAQAEAILRAAGAKQIETVT